MYFYIYVMYDKDWQGVGKSSSEALPAPAWFQGDPSGHHNTGPISHKSHP